MHAKIKREDKNHSFQWSHSVNRKVYINQHKSGNVKLDEVLRMVCTVRVIMTVYKNKGNDDFI